MGILAAIAIPRFSGMREDANEGAVISNLRNIQSAAEIVAANENALITDTTKVNKEKITTALGAWPTGPAGAVYDWSEGEATVTTAPSVYPSSGVMKYSDINSGS